MIELIAANLYRIEIPLPNNPLKSLNAFLIRGGGRNLLIDTGMNRPECLEVMEAALRELEVKLEDTDFFITHMHADHSGLVGTLAQDTSKIYASQIDAEVMNNNLLWDKMRIFIKLGGFPLEEYQQAIKLHPGYKYSTKKKIDFTIVKDGDLLTIGEYRFQCIETPGHTTGHLCLYEADKKMLISGDHILGDITPNISLWSDEEDPLSDYLASLDKVSTLKIDITLPAHRSLINNCQGRIEELKQHHQERAQEVLDVLAQGGRTAYQVAAGMTWDMTYKSFQEFPIPQKWFATGEAMAHIKYLEVNGKVKRQEGKEQILFLLQ
ncbi:MAG: MBL fold metallo-hydrolase [Bacillota bacterium]|nr:MBL fold metallo-hydrolase [Bacillota bacterium]